MKLTFNSSKKQNSEDQIYELLIIFLPCKYLQWAKKWGTLWSPQNEMIYRAV